MTDPRTTARDRYDAMRAADLRAEDRPTRAEMLRAIGAAANAIDTMKSDPDRWDRLDEDERDRCEQILRLGTEVCNYA